MLFALVPTLIILTAFGQYFIFIHTCPSDPLHHCLKCVNDL